MGSLSSWQAANVELQILNQSKFERGQPHRIHGPKTSKADCRVGEEDYIHVPNVVFTCGCLPSEDGVIRIYYAGNDTVMNLGFTHRDVLIALCERFGQDPISGKRLYVI